MLPSNLELLFWLPSPPPPPPWACRYGTESIVSLLLQSGANPNAPAFDGTTPLHFLARLEKLDDSRGKAMLLISAGAALESRDVG